MYCRKDFFNLLINYYLENDLKMIRNESFVTIEKSKISYATFLSMQICSHFSSILLITVMNACKNNIGSISPNSQVLRH